MDNMDSIPQCMVTCLIAPSPDLIVVGSRSPILRDLDKEMELKGTVVSERPIIDASASTLLVPEYVASSDKMMKYIEQWRPGVQEIGVALGNVNFDYAVDNMLVQGRLQNVYVCYVLWYTSVSDNSSIISSDTTIVKTDGWLNKSDDDIMVLVRSAINKISIFRDQNYGVNRVEQLPSILSPVDYDVTMKALSMYGVRGSRNQDWFQTSIVGWIKFADDAMHGLDYTNQTLSWNNKSNNSQTEDILSTEKEKKNKLSNHDIMNKVNEQNEVQVIKLNKDLHELSLDKVAKEMKDRDAANASMFQNVNHKRNSSARKPELSDKEGSSTPVKGKPSLDPSIKSTDKMNSKRNEDLEDMKVNSEADTKDVGDIDSTDKRRRRRARPRKK